MKHMSNTDLIGGTYEADTYCLEDLPVSPTSKEVGVIFPDTKSDTPTHCATCGVLIPCRLTSEGKQYVAEAIVGHLDELAGDPAVVWCWAYAYRDEVFPLLDERQQKRAAIWLSELVGEQQTLSDEEYFEAVPPELRKALWVPYEADPDEIGAFRPGVPTQEIFIGIGGALYNQFDVRAEGASDVAAALVKFMEGTDLHGEDWEVAVVEGGMDVANWRSNSSVEV